MMLKQSFGNRTYRITRAYNIPGFDNRRKRPILVRDRIQIFAAFQKETAFFCQIRQWILKAVINLRQKSRPQLNTHQLAGKFRPVPHFDALRHLINLHVNRAVAHTNDLTLQPFAVYQDVPHFILSHRAVNVNGYKVAVDARYSSCNILHPFTPVLPS